MDESLYRVIGLMSGTSMDGVDIALCEFSFNTKWSFKLIASETIAYSPQWLDTLKNLHLADAEKISKADADYGSYLGRLVKQFLNDYNTSCNFISSHGHTIFHQPGHGFTKQIGSGACIHAVTGIKVVSDFRSLDVALGGQGAPLVPVGDQLLFPKADYCLNLGGIANISFTDNKVLRAYDICACNMVLNHLASMKGKQYDEDGELAFSGKTDQELLKKLSALPFYNRRIPKSLGREDIEKDLLPLINASSLSVEDKMATFCEHIAQCIAASVTIAGSGLLITGGGAFNKFLIQKIKQYVKAEIILPEPKIIMFKEAIIFAFLGVLRLRNEVNAISTVTGAENSSSGGCIWG
jgi:anhydro-N-acetylmuramic acid kinase